jgi:hypothetical protein
MVGDRSIAEKYRALAPALNERTPRLWAGAEARALGRGGVTFLSRVTGLSRNAISRGMREADSPDLAMGPERIRRPGGGRRRKAVLDPALVTTLESLVDPLSRGDPESPLRWTCKSTRNLSTELGRSGYEVSHTLVGRLLGELGYRLQANRKTKEGRSHPDRNAEFERVNAHVARQVARGEPAIPVDTNPMSKSPEEVRPCREEGAGRRIREWRAGMASCRQSREGKCVRLRRSRARKGRSPWSI